MSLNADETVLITKFFYYFFSLLDNFIDVPIIFMTYTISMHGIFFQHHFVKLSHTVFILKKS